MAIFYSSNRIYSMNLTCALLFVLLANIGLQAQKPYKKAKQEIVFCGDDKVLIADATQTKDSIPFIVWQWQPSMDDGLPLVFRTTYLRTIDDCKPVHGGKDILVTSSKGGVALVNRATKKASFYAQVTDAHTAELLPNNRVVVALSTGENGNAIRVFDLNKSDSSLTQDTLYSGHGVIWDEDRKQLYALGFSELRIYTLKDWDTKSPQLIKQAVYKIPDRSGHDLQMMPPKQQLIFTTADGVWVFDISKKEFAPFKPLENRKDVKSVSFNAITKQMIYTQAEESWWTFHINFLDTEKKLAYPSVKIYKARWLVND